MPVVAYESNAPLADETDGRGDDFADLRVFCARTGVFLPEPGGINYITPTQMLRIMNALAKHLEALERIVLAQTDKR